MGTSWPGTMRNMGRIRFPLLRCVSGRLDIKVYVLKLGTKPMAISQA